LSTLNQIQLIQFKNHLKLELAFKNRITALIGPNGSGKTNILDAIYYVCYGRSFFSSNDKQVGNFNVQGFRVDGFFANKNENDHIYCIYREDGKKEIWHNDESLKKTSALLGLHTCVMIAPDDISLINDGSEERRKFVDAILCQTNSNYLVQLQSYNKILLQRNALLKQMHENPQTDKSLLQIYNNQLQQYGSYVYSERHQLIQYLQPIILQHYKTIAGKVDAISLQYQSQLHQISLLHLLQQNEYKDLASQRTNYGVHKDDLAFVMHNEPLKNIASQGQKKSFLLALKLTELHYLQQHAQSQPMLLLDDIFERLDNDRIKNLFNYISTLNNVQVFITDTNAQRVEAALKAHTADFELTQL
jgi:DNA replication and repair protein RecF